ncbi:MAG: hypothetical protein JNN08_04950 [Bryobacterales bacterium]|nr:hypothetical protein [Bryobacterales bacterium]
MHETHRRFWAGEGRPLLLLPASGGPQYDTEGYAARFADPKAMLQAELDRALPVIGWPTDGIPTVRPNLGVIFVPAMAGLSFEIRDGQMPWPGPPLSREAIRASRNNASGQTLDLALRFYAAPRPEGVAAYAPDTQGVFDIAMMLCGEPLLCALGDDPEWADEVLEIALDWYLLATRAVKEAIGEPRHEMVHGHGTPQGVFFPHGGARVSEDSATLLSPRMLDRFVLPYVERALGHFDGGFVHFCGRHKYLFEALCRLPLVRAIDLGNSELYDTRWLFETTARHGVALYSRIAAEPGESWRAYLDRIATLIDQTGARVILRPMAVPESRGECAEAFDWWRHRFRAAK